MAAAKKDSKDDETKAAAEETSEAQSPATTTATVAASNSGDSEPEFVDGPHDDAKAVDVSFENGRAVLEQDVYEKVSTPRAQTATYRLVGRKGQTITRSA